MGQVERLPCMGNGVDIDRDEEVMRATRTLRRSGGSMVVTVPREMIDNVGFEEGDTMLLEAEILGDEICFKEAPDVELADGEEE